MTRHWRNYLCWKVTTEAITQENNNNNKYNTMTGRQLFSEIEKFCLQELVIKYKLNSASTISAGNPAVKKKAWARLMEEFNSMETNSKRTEAQLKKCWDNLKTRRKAILAQEKKERMKTGGGPFQPTPSTSKDDIIDKALVELTDVELTYAIDSDNIPSPDCHYVQNTSMEDEAVEQETPHESLITRTPQIDAGRRSTSRHTHSTHSTGHQTLGGKNVRAKVISEEFDIRKENYIRIKEREEELHTIHVAEKKWLVKAAEELYNKACVDRQAAEELLACNKAKREEAELQLLIIKRQFDN